MYTENSLDIKNDQCVTITVHNKHNFVELFILTRRTGLSVH